MYLIFIQTCEYLHIDTAKEIDSNDWDFQHKGDGVFNHTPGALECCFSTQVILVEAKLTVPSCGQQSTCSVPRI